MKNNIRIKKLQEKLKKINLDAIYLTKRENIRYLTGFSGSFSVLVVGQEKTHIFTDFRYLKQVEEETFDIELVKLERYSIEYFVFELCRKENYQNLGFEFNSLSYSSYQKLLHFFSPKVLKETIDFVETLRMVKDEEEIELIRKAESIGDRAFSKVLSLIKPGVSELEIACELDYQMRVLGASGNSFETIVASGYRGALPHGIASEKKIQNGELVVMDFGCFYKGYASDMTRTIGVGNLGNQEKEVYQVVLEAQNKALSVIKSGVIGNEVHKVAHSVIEEAGYGKYFGHGLGHSVGLEIHEQPNFNLAEKREILSGMCLSVEPGIYLPNKFGVRIEDLIVVREDGFENLTKSNKALILL